MADISTFFGGVLGAIGKVGGSYVTTPIKNPFSYLFSFNGNIKNLEDKVEKLEPRRASLQQEVLAAERNLESVLPDVEDWLRRVDEIKTENERIHEARDEIQKHGFRGWWLNNLRLRYSLSREAKKTARASVELIDGGQFERISIQGYPADLQIILDGSEFEFESRKAKEEQIIDALKDKDVHMIGICGMGGVGKTIMVKKISNLVREEKLFDEVVMAVVSQQPNLLKLQEEIAEGLSIELEAKLESNLRARQLHTRIEESKSVLIILDDVWERLDLKEIGIPSPSTTYGCKIILTSRIHHVCVEMNATKILSIEVLNEKESWVLFREKAGSTIDAPDLHQIAEEVAKECKGLPLALVTLGNALRGEINLAVWEDALMELRFAAPNVSRVLKHVYWQLKKSYNQLENDEARYLFFLCCLFPEDSNIPLDHLVDYGMGLQIFSGMTLMDARNRVCALVEMLKDCFLLEIGENAKNVKMHSIIRNMAILIASEYRHVFTIIHDLGLKEWPERGSYDDCTSISVRSDQNVAFPERIDGANLEFLRIEIGLNSEKETHISDHFFDGVRGLKVLDIDGVESLGSSLQWLTNLRTLHLHLRNHNCQETIHIIGKLVNLEILRLNHTYLEELPKEIGGLKNLKLLDLRGCQYLRIIAPGVIAGLVGLEELLMSDSFSEWEAEVGEERKNASLVEVASLENLAALELCIYDPEVLPQDTCHQQEFRRYHIMIGILPEDYMGDKYYECDKGLAIELSKETPLRNWIHVLSRDVEYLNVNLIESGECDVVLRLVQEGFQKVKVLQLKNCDKVEYLADNFNACSPGNIIFPLLEELHLSGLGDLKVICHGPQLAGSFGELKELKLENLFKLTFLWDQKLCLPNLTKLFVINCSSLRYVAPLSTAESLLQLDDFRVWDCPVLEEVFTEERGKITNVVSKIIFPKLNYLSLERLPILRSLCKAVDGIEFPLLQFLNIEGLILFDQKVSSHSEPLSLARSSSSATISTLEPGDMVEPLGTSTAERSAEKAFERSLVGNIATSSSFLETESEERIQEQGTISENLKMVQDVSEPLSLSISPLASSIAMLESSNVVEALGTSTAETSAERSFEISLVGDNATSSSFQEMESEEGISEQDSIKQSLEVVEEVVLPDERNMDLIHYCCVFPSDFEFTRDTLVWSWIGMGLVKAGKSERMEEVGFQCFNDLLNEEYFLPSGYDQLSDQARYKLSDSMNFPHQTRFHRPLFGRGLGNQLSDMLQFKEKSLVCEDTYQMSIENLDLQRLLLLCCRGPKVKHLSRDLFLELKDLRIMDLSHADIVELPHFVGKMKSLRYLDISETPIRRLPESIDQLTNLQTLRLVGCPSLYKLPRYVNQLINLRHLVLDASIQSKLMPIGIGKLTNLQTLRIFVVGKVNGCYIEELKHMNNLSGSLRILNLESILNKEEAMKAELSKKSYLKKLELRWSDLRDEKAPMLEQEVLEGLQPPFCLEELKLLSYGGEQFPFWVSNPSFNKIASITIYKCRNCISLPSLGALPSLEYLSVIEVNEVRHIDSLFCRTRWNRGSQAFPKLKKLTLDAMLSLEIWSGVENDDFPCLVQLTVKFCPKLASLPHLSHINSLKNFEISHCEELSHFPEEALPDSLETLTVKCCPKMKERCCKDSGEEWSKISHVPVIYIDHEKISVS